MLAEYEILGLEKNATRAEITAAYRRAAMRWHPDRNPDNPQAKERFQEIERAHRLLLQITPQIRLVSSAARAAAEVAAADVAADVAAAQAAAAQAAVAAWRAARATEAARRQHYERQRQATMQAREAHIAQRNKITTPVFSLCTIAIALLLAGLLPYPFNIVGLSALLLVAWLLRPKQEKTYTGVVLNLVIDQGVKFYFIGLLGWFLWKMAARIAW